MAERMTEIHPLGHTGLAEWGRKTSEEMITTYRRYIDQLREEVRIADATPDDCLHIVTYAGVHVQRNREIIQQGKKAP